MIVVSGCPRSGTSLMMEIMGVLLGKENIIGRKFPRELPNASDPDSDEPPNTAKEYRQYLRAKRVNNARLERTRDMNPDGFWECQCTVRGLHYHPRNHDILKDSGPNKVIKVVSQGLANSDPRYVDKLIYMVRHPDNVAKSQERLIRPGFNDSESGGPREPNGEEVRIFSYQMFNSATVLAARWIDRFKPDILVVNFDELIDKPRRTIRSTAEFVLPAVGELEEAYACVKPSLRRSVEIPEHDEKLGQELAYALYDVIKVGDFAGVNDIAETFRDKLKEERQRKGPLPCARLGRQVSREECGMCRNHEITRSNFKKTAEKRRIDWRNEPCAYDCIVDKISIEDSIANNHWI